MIVRTNAGRSHTMCAGEVVAGTTVISPGPTHKVKLRSVKVIVRKDSRRQPVESAKTGRTTESRGNNETSRNEESSVASQLKFSRYGQALTRPLRACQGFRPSCHSFWRARFSVVVLAPQLFRGARVESSTNSLYYAYLVCERYLCTRLVPKSFWGPSPAEIINSS